MTKETIRNKTTTKKSYVTSNMDFEAFIKNQQNIVSRLKTDLKSAISQAQLSDCGTAEKDKKILELEYSINHRDAEILKFSTNCDQLREENSKILRELNSFKETFYRLEIDYDRTLNQHKQESENMQKQLQQQQSIKDQEIQELSLKCHNLQQSLQNNINGLAQLNKQQMETLQNFEQMKTNFEHQQREFEFYKQQVNEEKRLNEEKSKLDFDNLKDELRQKDEMLKQCILDKNVLEKEKNRIIDELNNKIIRIERACTQPTKVVQPLVNLPQPANSLDHNSLSESSADNLAVSKPQVRKPLANLSAQNLFNNDNQKVEQNQTQRNYRFKRPDQLVTSSQKSNVGTNDVASRKRRSQPLRQLPAIKNYNEISESSSDADDDDDSNYNGFSQQLWRPNNECYVADTDASEGFANPKVSKK